MGDIHFPWHSEAGLSLAMGLLAKQQYDLIIQVGDLYDLLSFSKYPRTHNLMTPTAETDEARLCAVSMWSEIRKLQPKARLVQLVGNHDRRPFKRVMEALPAIQHLVEPTLNALYRFDGVETHMDDSKEFVHQGVIYQHGFRQFGAHVTWNLMPTVNGHLHRGGVIYRQTQQGTIWELNVGWLGDAKAPVFGYIPQKKIHGTTLGVGIVDELGPRFVPF